MSPGGAGLLGGGCWRGQGILQVYEGNLVMLIGVRGG